MDKGKKLSTADKVYEIALPVAQELGLEIWDVVFVKEGADWFLRIFIDKDGGVGIDDCVNMTKAIDPILDEEDPVPHSYSLEVSSPGINRRLNRTKHFEALKGEPVQIKLIRPLEDGTRVIEGILMGPREGGAFEVQIDDETSAVFEKKECSSVCLLDDDFDI